jgi:hypothetical protein
MKTTMAARHLQPGERVRVTQTIRRRDGNWTTSVTGEVIEHLFDKTGSWYAHAPHGKLLLNRLRLRKPDGEISLLTLDENSIVESLEPQAADKTPAK